MTWRIEQGDCLDVMRAMPNASVDAVVTDPPYGFSFMGREWDHGIPGVPFWTEALRVAKPGAHLLAFGGTRTFHRLACAIEDAGWEIRDCIMWVYGSGFPKSLDVSKAIDKAAGVEREVVGPKITGEGHIQNRKNGLNQFGTFKIAQDGFDMETAPATPAAARWQGFGTALKPSWEPIIVARKPLDGTVAANVLRHGTGAINVDGCRVPTSDNLGGGGEKAETAGKFTNEGWRRPWMDDPVKSVEFAAKVRANVARAESLGRFPANLVHDGSDDVVALFPREAGAAAPVRGTEPSTPAKNTYGTFARGGGVFHSDSGSAARFFYCAKADRSDRGDGNTHPTVKPASLMQWLCRLVTPPRGTILDPFAGSGSTGVAALREGFNFIGIEREPDYVAIAERRIRDDAPLLNGAA